MVLRGTVENSWFNTSTSGRPYIEINEYELMHILGGEELQKSQKIAKEDELLFRL